MVRCLADFFILCRQTPQFFALGRECSLPRPFCLLCASPSNTRKTECCLTYCCIVTPQITWQNIGTISTASAHASNTDRQTDKNSVVVTVPVTFCVCVCVFFCVTCFLLLCISFMRENKLMRSACYLSVLHTSPRIFDHLTELRRFCVNFMKRGEEKKTT